MEIVFNCWSVAGVWYFYLSEPVLGFPHVHSPFNSDFSFNSEQAFTFETVWKFWIGFVLFPGLWTVIGMLLCWRSFNLISEHVECSESLEEMAVGVATEMASQLRKDAELMAEMEDGNDNESDDEVEKEVVAKKKKSSRSKSKGRGSSKKKSNKYVRTTTLVANLRDPEVDKDISTTLRPRSRRSTRNR